MTSERHEQYRAALAIIDALGPSKLHPAERETLAGCAEDLLLSDDPLQARVQREAALELLDRLVLSGRWLAPTARELGGHIQACGPAALLAA